MATTARNDNIDDELVARLAQLVKNGGPLPMALCVDGQPFGRTDRHIFAAGALAGFDAEYCLDLDGPLNNHQLAALQEKESARWDNLRALAEGKGKDEDARGSDKAGFEVANIDLADMPTPDPDQVTDPQVTEWCREVYEGRVPEVTRVPVVTVRSNPFVLRYHEEHVDAVVGELIRGGEVADQLSWLVVARLPDGGFVDVDTPYPCEAVKRAGLATVKVTIVGSFTRADCERLGLPTQYPTT